MCNRFAGEILIFIVMLQFLIIATRNMVIDWVIPPKLLMLILLINLFVLALVVIRQIKSRSSTAEKK